MANLITVANYAKSQNVTSTWIYRLAKKGKIEIVEIDGVKFVDIKNKK